MAMGCHVSLQDTLLHHALHPSQQSNKTGFLSDLALSADDRFHHTMPMIATVTKDDWAKKTYPPAPIVGAFGCERSSSICSTSPPTIPPVATQRETESSSSLSVILESS
eukprot:3536511-Karenia_brevis.AAC.1